MKGLVGGRRTRRRAGQALGLLFLLGPLTDLASSTLPTPRLAAVWVLFAGFVALYFALLPPIRWIACRGPRAVEAALGLLAATAALTLVLGAPSSFVLLFVYVVAAAGMLLPSRSALAVIAVTAAGVGIGLGVAGEDSSTVAAHVLTVLAVGALMAALGRETRANRALQAAREELARNAVSEERLRIARDLHDLLGHTLSLIALKSELATKLVETDPARARAEIEDVQAVTRQALAEVRAAVHGYRGLALDEALAGARDVLSTAGIECRVDADADGLPEEVESVLAWAVREAATNVVRHSGARACAITLSAEADAVSLQVEDDGAAPPSPASAPGVGLAGLAERARRLHGTLESGARPGGGFLLRVTLPLRA